MPIDIRVLPDSGSGRLLKETSRKYQWPADTNVVVDWTGNGQRWTTQANDIVLNGIGRRNNIDQILRFKEAGLVTPNIITTLAAVIRNQQENPNRKFWGRLNEHSQGKDIVDERMGKRFVDSQYWVEVIPNIIQEWRIHVVWGRRIARGLKFQAGDPDSKLHKFRKDLPIRNRKFGWLMRHDVPPPEEVSTTAKKAVTALGYNFGAVDLYVTEDEKVGVLEVNRVPGLDNSSANAYIDAFYKIANKEWKRSI